MSALLWLTRGMRVSGSVDMAHSSMRICLTFRNSTRLGAEAAEHVHRMTSWRLNSYTRANNSKLLYLPAGVEEVNLCPVPLRRLYPLTSPCSGNWPRFPKGLLLYSPLGKRHPSRRAGDSPGPGSRSSPSDFPRDARFQHPGPRPAAQTLPGLLRGVLSLIPTRAAIPPRNGRTSGWLFTHLLSSSSTTCSPFLNLASNSWIFGA